MGFRSGFIISSVSFLYGIIFIASIYDFPLLYYSPLVPEAVDAAERFYLSFYNGPTAITALLHGMIALGVVGLIAKLHRWSDTAKYFDGGSLALLMASIMMYAAVAIPNVRLLTDPNNEALLQRSSIRTQREDIAADEGAPPIATGPMTPDERVAALRILAASNTICAFLLAGIVLLQFGEWWIERGEKLDQEKERARAVAALGKGENKKDK